MVIMVQQFNNPVLTSEADNSLTSTAILTPAPSETLTYTSSTSEIVVVPPLPVPAPDPVPQVSSSPVSEDFWAQRNATLDAKVASAQPSVTRKLNKQHFDRFKTLDLRNSSDPRVTGSLSRRSLSFSGPPTPVWHEQLPSQRPTSTGD